MVFTLLIVVAIILMVLGKCQLNGRHWRGSYRISELQNSSLTKRIEELEDMNRDIGRTADRMLKDREEMIEKECKEHFQGIINRLRESEKKLNQELDNRKKLSGVKFTANVPTSGWTRTEFKLGSGKCGKEVIALTFTEELDHYLLTQFHSDTTRKTFKYLKEDVAGRIELAYH